MSTAFTPKGFVCEYKKQTAWFARFEIRYIVIEDDQMKVFKNEKEYCLAKKRNHKASLSVTLRNARLRTASEKRHPHILSIQVRDVHHCLSFVNQEQLRECEDAMYKCIQAANLILPTPEQESVLQVAGSNIDVNDVNSKYRAVLGKLGLPRAKIDELVRTQSFVAKMEIVRENEREINEMIDDDQKRRTPVNEHVARNVTHDVMHWIRVLRRPHAVAVADVTDICSLIYEENGDVFLSQLVHEQGITLLVALIPHHLQQVDADCAFVLELLQCLKVICDQTRQHVISGSGSGHHDKIGLHYIVQDATAIQGIVDLFDVHDAHVSLLIIKLLSAICWHSPQGFEQVIDALEVYTENTDEECIWTPIVRMLKTMIAEISNAVHAQYEDQSSSHNVSDDDDDDDEDGTYVEHRSRPPRDRDPFPFEYVLFTFGLINAIINSFVDLEERVAYRRSLEQLGFDKVVTYLSDLVIAMEEALLQDADADADADGEDDDSVDVLLDDPWIGRMDEHLDLYNAVKHNDARDASLDGLDLSNPSDLFEFLEAHCVEDGFVNQLTHILQCLTTIPSNAVPVWSTLEKIVSHSTAPIRNARIMADGHAGGVGCVGDDAEDEDAQGLNVTFPTFEQLKTMIARYDQDLAYTAPIDDELREQEEQISLLQEQVLNLKFQLSEHQTMIKTLLREQKGGGGGAGGRGGGGVFAKIANMFQSTTNMQIDDGGSAGDDSELSLHSLSPLAAATGLPPPSTSADADVDDDDAKEPPAVDLSKYLKMVKLGIPLAAAANKMKGDGLDPDILQEYIENGGSLDPPKPRVQPQSDAPKTDANKNSSSSSATAVRDDSQAPEKLGKYLKMVKLQIPMARIKNQMKQNGDDWQELDDWLNGKTATTATTTAPPATPPKELAPYLKMVKLKIPMKVIQNRMKTSGVDAQKLDDWLNQKPAAPAVKAPPAKLQKYLKMHKTKIPLKVIRNKMKLNGDDPKELDDWLKGETASPSSATAATPVPKEPPAKLQNYLKMHKMQLPLKVIYNKMKLNGDDPKELDAWLNGTAASATASAPKSVTKAKKAKKEDPFAVPPGMARKPVVQPKVKMRAFHWNMVKPKEVKDTIWDGLDETQIEIDTSEFEKQFMAKQTAKKPPPATATATGTATTDDKPTTTTSQNGGKIKKGFEEIKLVDPKRSYNVDIGLNRFKLSHQQIKDAILAMNDSVLNLEKITKLRNYIPDASEQETLRKFGGDVTQLAHTERFFLALCNIPDLGNRMEYWQFKVQFHELLQTQTERVQVLQRAHDHVHKSAAFRTVLQYILAFGNYMNGGTKKGQAFGFKLNSLRQLASAKSADNKTTLLQYLYLQIEQRHASALSFVPEFAVLAEGSRLDTSQLNAEVSQIGGSLRRIEAKLKADVKVKKTPRSSTNDMFATVMNEFLQRAHLQHKQLHALHEKAVKDCTALARYLHCENDVKFEFFKELYEFTEAFKRIKIGMEKQREKAAKEERNAQIKAQRAQRLQKQHKNTQQQPQPKNNVSAARPAAGARGRSASQLYLKKGLHKSGAKNTNPSVNTNSEDAADTNTELMRAMQRQKAKTGTAVTNDAGARANNRATIRKNSRNLNVMAQDTNPVKSPKSNRSVYRIDEHSAPMPSGHTTDISQLSNGPTSPISPTSPYQANGVPMTGLSGLPPPNADGDEYDNDDGGAWNGDSYKQNQARSPLTESVIDDIKFSQVPRRRKASSLFVDGPRRRKPSSNMESNRKYKSNSKQKKHKKPWL